MAMGKCPDCGVEPGQAHLEGCDVERCPTCGGQYISCGHTAPHRLPWSGEWPGVAECREFGWYALFSPSDGWVRCGADQSGAHPDLNRLHTDATWDRQAKRFVLRPVNPAPEHADLIYAQQLRERIDQLEAENARLREEMAKLKAESARLRHACQRMLDLESQCDYVDGEPAICPGIEQEGAPCHWCEMRAAVALALKAAIEALEEEG